MKNFESDLILQKVVYDTIRFDRKGFKNDNQLEFRLQIQIGQGQDNEYRVVISLEGDKKEEYSFLISLSGYFTFNNAGTLAEDRKKVLLNKNAVALLMPYLRSEVTILTAQPDTDSVVLPAFNINKMFEEGEI